MRNYDRSFASITERLLHDLRQAGHAVETPDTGCVIVDGIEITPERWDQVAAEYDGDDLDAVLEALGIE